MNQVLRGRVQAGKGDASRWLSLFNAAYSRKLGHPIYPGSLNLALDHDFRWFDPAYKAHLICFGRGEYGGDRDILFLPCELGVPGRRKAWLWTPTTAARERADPWVIELVSDVRLRDVYAIEDGSSLEITLSLGPELPDSPNQAKRSGEVFQGVALLRRQRAGQRVLRRGVALGYRLAVITPAQRRASARLGSGAGAG